MKEKITEIISSACFDLFGYEVIVDIEYPEEKFGDYSTNIAMKLSKELEKNPRDIAQEIVLSIGDNPAIKDIGVAGPGFINLSLNDKFLVESLDEPPKKTLSGMKILVEYSDPNPFKPLHAGHLYTTLVGDSISRLIEYSGAETIRINYGGDVGLHVAKTMWAILVSLGGEETASTSLIPDEDLAIWLGNRYVEGNNAYSDNQSAKLEIDELNKRIYQIHEKNDRESDFAQIYWMLREASYDLFKSLYVNLDVTSFDRYIPESEVTQLGYSTVVEQLDKGVFEKSEGAIIFDGEKYGLFKNVFVSSAGLPTYSAKDVGLSLTKWKDYKFDESIIITANEQSQYMEVVIKAIEQFCPEPAIRTRHLTHGVVKLQGGEKMSSREGNVVFADDILNAARMVGSESGLAEKDEVVLAAVKYSFLKNRIGGDVIYDPKESIAIEGNSGPYLQYAHARACSIISKTKISGSLSNAEFDEFERSLARKLSQFTDIVERAALDFSPHLVCSYLYELAQVFNRFYENSKVIGSDRENIRIELVNVYIKVLSQGLELLGIKAPKKM